MRKKQSRGVCLVFHVPSTSVSARDASSRIGRVLDSHFGDLVSPVKYAGDSEIVFFVQFPVMRDKNVVHQFFESLQKVFVIFDKYCPHFTQLPESV